VTLSPDTLVAADSVVHHRTYALVAGDTMVNGELNTSVLHRTGTATSGVEAVIVRYLIERAPPGVNNAQTLLLLNGSLPTDRDTSVVTTGRASLTARLRLLAKSTFTTDTALISATASYAGRQLGRVLFTLIFSNASASP
jgi:hypothetical protein